MKATFKVIWKATKILFEAIKQFIMISIFCISSLLTYDNLKDVNSLNELSQVNLVYAITFTLICIIYLIQTFKNIKSITKGE